MDMDQLVTMQAVLLRWLKWDNKSEKELTVLTLLEILPQLLEKVLLLDQLHWSPCHFMVVSYTMLNWILMKNRSP